jgi:hypothetical protein
VSLAGLSARPSFDRKAALSRPKLDGFVDTLGGVIERFKEFFRGNI